jgi:DNA-binding transcriptional regulator YiaG
MYHYTESGLRNVWLANGYAVRKTPYGKGVAIENLEGLHRAIARQIIRLPRPLSGAEFRFLRKELELSQAGLADYLGCNVQALARWEKGKSRIPKPAERLLRALYRESDEGNAQIRELVERIGRRHAAAQAKFEFARRRGEWKAAA